MLHKVTERTLSFFSIARLFVCRGGGRALHLCDMLAAATRSGIPSIPLTEFLAPLWTNNGTINRAVVIHPQVRGTGAGSAGELAALCAITAAKMPRSVLEFGTYAGCSTWHLLANAHPDAKVLTIDLPAGSYAAGSTDVGLQGHKSRPFLPDDARVQLLEVDSRQWHPAIGGGVDLCFIDAGHSYECVRNDTEKAISVMNPGGVILWHDSVWRRDGYGVNQYLKELRATGRAVRLIDLGQFDYCGLAVMII